MVANRESRGGAESAAILGHRYKKSHILNAVINFTDIFFIKKTKIRKCLLQGSPHCKNKKQNDDIFLSLSITCVLYDLIPYFLPEGAVQ